MALDNTRGVDRTVVSIATAISLALGFFFVFVRAPHPWGWEGFDHYHELGLAVARGDGLATMIVPAGYPTFLAAFYRLFGDQPVIPICAQVLLNALIPLMMYRLVRTVLDRRTAALTALLVGALSFNTIYASTQASDSVCNVLFVAGMLCLATGVARDQFGWIAAAAALFAAASQFRPNLLLWPLMAAALILYRSLSARHVRQAVLMLLVSGLVYLPWTIRNYWLTGEILPTSTLAPLALWYGTLQTGPYLSSRVTNPSSMHEEWPFQSSSVANRPVIMRGRVEACSGQPPASLDVVYWTDRNPAHTRVAPTSRDSRGRWIYQLPAQSAPTALYYYLTAQSDAGSDPEFAPVPAVAFITGDFLHDPDRHGDLLDVFDIARMVKHVVWGDAVPFADRLDADHDGRLTESDLAAAVVSLVAIQHEDVVTPDVVSLVSETDGKGVVAFADGSALIVPRTFDGKYTDLEFSIGPTGKIGQVLVWQVLRAAVPIAQAARPDAGGPFTRYVGDPWPLWAWRQPQSPCRLVEGEVNSVFYRNDPSQMHRYAALSLENIKRDVIGFAIASAYRVYRVFVVYGTADVDTAHQFAGSRRVYTLATTASMTILLLAAAGIAIAARRRILPLLLIAPPVYIAVTISPFATNMRYSITAQPFVLAFAAVALLWAYDRLASHAGRG